MLKGENKGFTVQLVEKRETDGFGGLVFCEMRDSRGKLRVKVKLEGLR